MGRGLPTDPAYPFPRVGRLISEGCICLVLCGHPWPASSPAPLSPSFQLISGLFQRKGSAFCSLQSLTFYVSPKVVPLPSSFLPSSPSTPQMGKEEGEGGTLVGAGWGKVKNLSGVQPLGREKKASVGNAHRKCPKPFFLSNTHLRTSW